MSVDTLTSKFDKPPLHQQKNLLQHLLQVDDDRRLRLAIESEHGAADLRDASQFLLGHVHKLPRLFRRSAVAHEVEQIGDRIERVVDLVRDGRGQPPRDSELFVCDQRILGLALHRDVAKYQNDSDDLSVFVAYRRAAVGDIQLRSVFADQNRVVRHADDAIEPLDLGDRGLHGLAGRLVDDVEDLFERLSGGLRLAPAGQLPRHWVHHLNAAGGIAGDHAVADGFQRRAQLLFGLKEFLGPAPQYLQRCPVRGRDRVQAIAGEQADQHPHAESQKQQHQQHGVDLLVPLRNAPRPVVLGLVDDVVEVVTDRVHQNLAVQVEGDIVGFAASADLGDDGNSEAVVPGLVLVAQIG